MVLLLFMRSVLLGVLVFSSAEAWLNINSVSFPIQRHRFCASKAPTGSDRVASLFQELKKEASFCDLISGGLCRMAQLSKALGKVGIDGVRNRENYLDQRGHLSFPIYVRKLFEEMGVTYIKLGQLIGSSPTLFPDEYVQEFRKCFDKAPPISYEEVRNIIQQDLAQPIHKIFPIFDRVPIATASVAQVHAANLQDGTRVAVKVRKPGVDLIIKTDLKFLWIASKILETLNPAISPLSLSHMVKDLRESMIDELDFRKELNNIDNFRTFIERNQITDVTAPKTFEDLSSERVLTMEYLDGISLSRFLEESSDSSAVETVLFSVLRTWARTINRNDRFHADLHAGNILVLPGNKVGFVDFGIVGLMNAKFKKSVQQLYHCFLDNDFRGMARSLVAIGATGSHVNATQFENQLRDVIESLQLLTLDNQFNYGEMDSVVSSLEENNGVNEVISKIFVVAEKNGLKLPREFGLLLKQALYFDRYYQVLGASLYPLESLGGEFDYRNGNEMMAANEEC